MAQSRLPPLITASVIALVLTIVGFWGYATHDAGASRIANIGRTHAVLNDGTCTFAAAVTLRPDADAWRFERRQDEVRAALVMILRSKSRYMVSNPTAREALRMQMLREVNRVMAEPVADELRFTEFVLS
jgi:flagellar basal body-associated protein FliL